MKRNLLKGLFAGLMLLAAAGAATAGNTLEPLGFNPQNGAVLPSLGNLSIYFSENIVDAETGGGIGSYPEMFDKITVTLNGNKQSFFTSGTGSASFKIMYVEPEGGGQEYQGIQLYLGDMSFSWKGDLNINIPAGVVKGATSGEGNVEINYNLKLYDTVESVPTYSTNSGGDTFEFGEGEIYVKWPGETISGINTTNDNEEEQLFAISVKSTGEGKNQTNMSSYASFSGDTMTLNVRYLQAGTYELMMQDGAILFEGNKISGTYDVYTFTIKAPVYTFNAGTVTPVSESTFTSLSDFGTIKVTWGGSAIELNSENETPILVTLNGQEIQGVTSAIENDTDLVITLPSASLQGGVYNVVIPEGYVLVTGSDNIHKAMCEEISASYNVLVAPEATFTPANGTEFNSPSALSTIKVTWPSCYFKFNGSNTQESVKVLYNNQALNTVSVTADWTRSEVPDYDGNVLVISLDQYELAELGGGALTVSVTDGLVLLAGPFGEEQVYDDETDSYYPVPTNTVPNNVAEATYPVVVPSSLPAPVVNPENGATVAELSNVTVTWMGYTLAENPDCTESTTLNGDACPATVNGNSIEFTFNGLEDGLYVVVIPEGYVIGTGNDGDICPNELVELSYIVDVESGVQLINAENGVYNVFNLNGQKVMSTTDANALRNLNGIFIINGKKVNVK